VTPGAARSLIEGTTLAWSVDPDNDVVWAGPFEGRWGIRVAQRARDFTTIWFDFGDLTVGLEAYLLPDPAHHHEEVYRYCLARNRSAWPASISLEHEGDLYVRTRVPLDDLTVEALDRAVGTIYETVELSFRTLVGLGFAREKSG